MCVCVYIYTYVYKRVYTCICIYYTDHTVNNTTPHDHIWTCMCTQMTWCTTLNLSWTLRWWKGGMPNDIMYYTTLHDHMSTCVCTHMTWCTRLNVSFDFVLVERRYARSVIHTGVRHLTSMHTLIFHCGIGHIIKWYQALCITLILYARYYFEHYSAWQYVCLCIMGVRVCVWVGVCACICIHTYTQVYKHVCRDIAQMTLCMTLLCNT
jgi:hypothetical protein